MDKFNTLYNAYFLLVFSNYIAASFLSLYIYSLQYSKDLIGIINSILALQSFFGIILSFIYRVFDHRKTFLLILIILQCFSWILILQPIQLNFYLHAILRAISIGGISILIAYYVFSYAKEKERIYVSNNLTFIFSIAFILSSFLGSLIICYSSWQAVFLIPIILLSILTLYVEKFIKFKEEKEKISIEKLKEIDKEFLKYTFLIFSFYFSVGVAGAYFSILLAEKIKFDIGICQDKIKQATIIWTIISTIEMIPFILMKKVIDKSFSKFDERKILIISTFLISLIPLIWISFKNIYIILLYSVISGIAWRLFDTASFSYLGKFAKDEIKISIFNLITSLGSSLGNLIGAFLSLISLEAVFYISFLLRFFVSLLFLKLEKGERKIPILTQVFLVAEYFNFIYAYFSEKIKKKIKA